MKILMNEQVSTSFHFKFIKILIAFTQRFIEAIRINAKIELHLQFVTFINL